MITTKCVLRFGDDGEAYMATIHPGVTVDDVLADTGWKLKVSDDLQPTSEPNDAELQDRAQATRAKRAVCRENRRGPITIQNLWKPRYCEYELYSH